RRAEPGGSRQGRSRCRQMARWHVERPGVDASPVTGHPIQDLKRQTLNHKPKIMLYSALINVMVKAARRAGRSLARDLGEIENLQVSLKGPANFVSLADKRAEEMLYTDLAKARPGYGF